MSLQKSKSAKAATVENSSNLIELGLSQQLNLIGTSADLFQVLKAQGLNQELSKTIEKGVKEYLDTQLSMDRLVADALTPLVRFESQLPLARKAVALIGPKGAGKTLTIAKLAARMQMAYEIKIGLISLAGQDSDNCALSTYASLLKIPCRTLDSNKSAVNELGSALKAFQDFDLILVDTMGCDAEDIDRLVWLKNLFGLFEEIEPMLVLPAPSMLSELENCAKAFERLSYERVVISKLDETGFVGPVINTVVQFGKSVSFLCLGERVPDDVEPGSARRLASLLSRTLH